MPRLPLVLAIMLALPTSCSAAGGSAAEVNSAVEFVCDDGIGFVAHYEEDGVRITTSFGQWLLQPRPSSIGRKFSSGEATFIHDEDRAALNGVRGGPFRRCHEPRAPAGGSSTL